MISDEKIEYIYIFFFSFEVLFSSESTFENLSSASEIGY